MAGSEQTTASPRPRLRDELELEVSGLAHGGRGVARRDGFVVFVSGALPGDTVRATVTKSKRRFAEARTIELLHPSPDRIPDRCLHGGEPCPGAPWQGLPYEQQLRHKSEQTEDALRRIGGLDGFELEPIEPANEAWRYRNKLEYSFGELDGEPALGFHARGRWDKVVAAEDCLLASERNNAVRNEVRDWAQDEGLPAYDRRSEQGVLRNLIVREGRRTGEIQTRLVTSAAEIPKPPVDLHTVIEGPGSGTDGPTGALGSEHLTEELCGLSFRISHRAFFQTNTEMAERLYATAAEFAALTGGERLFDLFCGIGTLGLAMAGGAGELWGIEVVPEAIADAEHNARRNGIENARFAVGDARKEIRPLIERAGRPDVVVVDPPRAGLSPKVVRRMIECDADRIVYVSCNPTTLAPNAAQLVEAGYRLSRVRPVDMFPQTPHIECVALLERDGAPASKAAGASEGGAGIVRGFGVAAGLDREVASPLAALCQELGYASIWSNDHPGAKGLETLAEFAAGAERIDLGVAVIALDRHAPEQIAADIERLDLDRKRLWLGVGAGFEKKPLTTMRDALPVLREALPGVRLVLAAMGPKMCALAGGSYDGAFFNWMTPGFAAQAREQVERGAAEAGRETPPVFGYVRTAVGDDAEQRLAKEEAFYRDLHQGYRSHFDRLDEPEGTVGVAAQEPGEAQTELSRYRALDTVVVRGLASATVEDMGRVAEAAGPGV